MKTCVFHQAIGHAAQKEELLNSAGLVMNKKMSLNCPLLKSFNHSLVLRLSNPYDILNL